MARMEADKVISLWTLPSPLAKTTRDVSEAQMVNWSSVQIMVRGWRVVDYSLLAGVNVGSETW